MRANSAIWQVALAAALGLGLGGCAVGVHGPKGNDMGGIIPWSPAAAREARAISWENCSRYGKRPIITSFNRGYGNYIAYECRFPRPRSHRRR